MRRTVLMAVFLLAVVATPAFAEPLPSPSVCFSASGTLNATGVIYAPTAPWVVYDDATVAGGGTPFCRGTFVMMPPTAAPAVNGAAPRLPPLSMVSLRAWVMDSGELVVHWETNVAATGRVAWGAEPRSFFGYQDDDSLQAVHGLVVDGLPRDRPLYVTVIAFSASHEIVDAFVQVPAPPGRAETPVNPAAASIALGSSVAVVAAARLAISRRR